MDLLNLLGVLVLVSILFLPTFIFGIPTGFLVTAGILCFLSLVGLLAIGSIGRSK